MLSDRATTLCLALSYTVHSSGTRCFICSSRCIWPRSQSDRFPYTLVCDGVFIYSLWFDIMMTQRGFIVWSRIVVSKLSLTLSSPPKSNKFEKIIPQPIFRIFTHFRRTRPNLKDCSRFCNSKGTPARLVFRFNKWQICMPLWLPWTDICLLVVVVLSWRHYNNSNTIESRQN